MVSPLLVGIVVLAVYLLIIISKAPQYVAFSYIAILFMFAIVIGLEKQGVFYSLFLLYFGILAFAKVKSPGGGPVAVPVEPPSGRFGFTQLGTVGLGILLGTGMAFLMLQMVASRGYSILGFPTFAVTTATISSVYAPALGGALGWIENRVFMTMKNVFSGDVMVSAFPVLELLAPIMIFSGPLIAASLFGLFHVTAYAFAAGSMIFAGLIFLLWNTTDSLGFGTLIADVSHYIYNFALIATTMGLSIL